MFFSGSKVSLSDTQDQYLVAPIAQQQQPRRVARVLWRLVTLAVVVSVYLGVQSASFNKERLEFSLVEGSQLEFDWYAVSRRWLKAKSAS